MKKRWIIAASLAVSLVLSAGAQDLPPNAPTKEQLAKDNKLFIELATKHLKWDEPAEPIRIVGSLYFVGTQGLSSWLFATSEGHILLNTGTTKSDAMIAESIRRLGFKPEEIRIIINGHAHSDHAGAFAYLKRLSDAHIAIMQDDVGMIEDGRKSDFYYGKDWQEAKRKRAGSEGVKAWVDPEGYRQFVASKRRAFEDEVDAEMRVPAGEKR